MFSTWRFVVAQETRVLCPHARTRALRLDQAQHLGAQSCPCTALSIFTTQSCLRPWSLPVRPPPGTHREARRSGGTRYSGMHFNVNKSSVRHSHLCYWTSWPRSGRHAVCTMGTSWALRSHRLSSKPIPTLATCVAQGVSPPPRASVSSSVQGGPDECKDDRQTLL